MYLHIDNLELFVSKMAIFPSYSDYILLYILHLTGSDGVFRGGKRKGTNEGFERDPVLR